jgi:hypothetical protein
MRLSWYADSAVAVFSIWQGNRCTGTFRLPFGDLDRMVQTLQWGPGGTGHYPRPAAIDEPDYGYQQAGYDAGDYAPAGYDGPGYEHGPGGYEGYEDYGDGAANYEGVGYDGYENAAYASADDQSPGYHDPRGYQAGGAGFGGPGYDRPGYAGAGYDADYPDHGSAGGQTPVRDGGGYERTGTYDGAASYVGGYSAAPAGLSGPSGQDSPRSYENPSSYEDLGYQHPGSYTSASGSRARTSSAGQPQDGQDNADWEAVTASYPRP